MSLPSLNAAITSANSIAASVASTIPPLPSTTGLYGLSLGNPFPISPNILPPAAVPPTRSPSYVAVVPVGAQPYVSASVDAQECFVYQKFNLRLQVLMLDYTRRILSLPPTYAA